MSQNSFFTANSFINPYPGLVLLNEKNKFIKKDIYENKHISFTPISVDLNGDGANDIVWINLKGPVKVYLNEKKNNNYFNVILPNNINFANSNIYVETDKLKLMKTFIVGGLGFASGQGNILNFGLGNSTKIKSVVIKTLYNKEIKFSEQPINSTLIIKNN